MGSGTADSRSRAGTATARPRALPLRFRDPRSTIRNPEESTPMARPPVAIPELVERFGPHPKYAPPGGWSAAVSYDKLVQTHCCICGQQCGIQLKVRDNKVVGFQPWEDFP